MNKIIYCNFHLFELHQRIYIVDLEDTTSPKEIAISNMESLGETISQMCNKYSIDIVHLFGNSQWAFEISKEINSNQLTNYNKSIQVEVNKLCLNI